MNSLLKNPENSILDVDGLAALLGISSASIPSQRSRSPEKLPPPYLTRPLRWRRETVVGWMKEQEERARRDADIGAPSSSSHRAVGSTAPCASGVHAIRGPFGERHRITFRPRRTRSKILRLITFPSFSRHAFIGPDLLESKCLKISPRSAVEDEDAGDE